MVPCPVGPRRRRRLPGRGRRRAPHPQRRARDLPLGPDHPLAEPARRRRRVPPHDRGRLGPRRPRRGAARVPSPDRAGHRLGLRREPPHQPPRCAAAAARVLRRLPRAGGRLRPPAAVGRRGGRARRRASPSVASPPTKASCSPTTWSRARPARAGASSASCSTSRPGSPSWRCTPASTPTSCAPRAATTGRAASRTTRCSARDPSFRDLVARSGAEVIGWRALRDLQRAPERSAAGVDRGEHVEHQPEVTGGLHAPLHERGAGGRARRSPPRSPAPPGT